MKTLSLLQPWASAIFTPMPAIYNPRPGRMMKEWETRGWNSHHRGLLLIQASKGKRELNALQGETPFDALVPEMGELTFGAIIGVVRLLDVITTEDWKKRNAVKMGEKPRAIEFLLGDYGDRRYAWHFKDAVKFDVPIPVRGSLNLWDFPRNELVIHFDKNPPETELTQAAVKEILDFR